MTNHTVRSQLCLDSFVQKIIIYYYFYKQLMFFIYKNKQTTLYFLINKIIIIKAISAPQAHAWLKVQPSPKLGLALMPDEAQVILKCG